MGKKVVKSNGNGLPNVEKALAVLAKKKSDPQAAAEACDDVVGALVDAETRLEDQLQENDVEIKKLLKGSKLEKLYTKQDEIKKQIKEVSTNRDKIRVEMERIMRAAGGKGQDFPEIDLESPTGLVVQFRMVKKGQPPLEIHIKPEEYYGKLGKEYLKIDINKTALKAAVKNKKIDKKIATVADDEYNLRVTVKK